MKVSLITTALNEENSIKFFLDSVLKQTKLPEELIIVDGGSTDRTVESIKYYVLSINRIKIRLIVKRGNRSVGRNIAIKNSTGDIIAVSDSGCILDKNWIAKITRPFSDKNVDVVAGYYKGKAKNIFQKCLIPYVLVMPDKLDAKTFLPSARSMAMRKSVWKKTGGFPEKYSHNEDYVFSRMLKRSNAIIFFAKSAIVYWLPRENINESFIMFFRFAFGDAEAGIWRPKVMLLYLRYIFGIALVILYLNTKSNLLLFIIYYLFVTYILLSILKNYKYVNHPMAFLYLPVLQLVSDAAVILGMSYGIIKRIMRK